MMKFLSIITVIALSTLMSAFPINGRDIFGLLSFDLPFHTTIHHRNYFNDTMEWIGPDSNGVNITLYGKANEVLSQLSALDPSWIDADPDPNHTTRSETPPNDKYTINCCPVAGEKFSPQNVTNVRSATNDLARLAQKYRMVTAPPPPSVGEEKTKAGCYTVTVSNGAAVVICHNVSLILLHSL